MDDLSRTMSQTLHALRHPGGRDPDGSIRGTRGLRTPVLLGVVLGLLVLAGPGRAVSPVRDRLDALRADGGEYEDQIVDPGEEEREGIELVEPPLPDHLDTPAEVAAYVHETLGADVRWAWDDCPANLVIVRNAGASYRPSPAEASYDDLFLVVTETSVKGFAYANAEGTEHRTYIAKYGYDRYTDPRLRKSATPALDRGAYRFLVGYHRGQYKALRVTDMAFQRFELPSQRRNGKYGKYEVGAVNVHKGGSSWNWSVGCLTVHYARYAAFIGLFPMDSWGRLYMIGEWNGMAGPAADGGPSSVEGSATPGRPTTAP